MHEPKAKGRLYCQPLMSAPSEQPLAPPDRQFWHRVTIAMCLSRQQRQNCLRLRGAHMHKMQDIIQQRYQINHMLQVRPAEHLDPTDCASNRLKSQWHHVFRQCLSRALRHFFPAARLPAVQRRPILVRPPKPAAE